MGSLLITLGPDFLIHNRKHIVLYLYSTILIPCIKSFLRALLWKKYFSPCIGQLYIRVVYNLLLQILKMTMLSTWHGERCIWAFSTTVRVEFKKALVSASRPNSQEPGWFLFVCLFGRGRWGGGV